ncbi:MAG: sugar ABC transporter permease [Candidatus Bathyarchaeia archaeon]
MRERKRTALVFSLPALSVLVAVVVLPISYVLFLSFTNYSFYRPTYDFIGIEKYYQIFLDQYFTQSLLKTALYILITVFLSLFFGLILSLLLNQKVACKTFHYLAIGFPMLIAPVGVGLIWKMILHPELGILSYMFGRKDFLGNPSYALITVALIDVWQQTSFASIVLLAGLRSLPKEPYEAAIIDGANAWQVFRYVTFPQILSILGILGILQILTELRTYDLIYVLTKGGPGVSTDLISYYIYRRAFLFLDLSSASAMSVTLLLLTLGLVSIFYWVFFVKTTQ